MRWDANTLLFATGVVCVCGYNRSPKYFPDRLHIEPGVVAEFAIIAGLVICLYGFRLLRAMIFLCGFLATGLLVSVAFENAFGLKTWVLAASWVGFVVVGIAGGCVALTFFPLGVFLVGSVLAYAFTSSLPYRMLPGESSAIVDGFVVVLGGMLAWLLVRPFAITTSSLMGSVGAVWGIGYFAGDYPSDDDIERFQSYMKRSKESWIYAVPYSWWAYLAAVLLLFVVGMTKQCRDVGKMRSYSRIDRSSSWRSSTSIPIP